MNKNPGRFRLRNLELAELAEVPRYLARYLDWQRAKILIYRYRELAELAEVQRYLARYLGWQRAKILKCRLRYLAAG